MAKDKASILNAAHEAFNKKAVHQVTLDEVAKAAKVDLKTLKSQFPNIDAVIHGIIEQDVTESTDLFTRIINDRGKADIKLARLVRELLTRYQKSRFLFTLVSIGLESVGEEQEFLRSKLTQEQLDRFRQNTAILGRLIAQGQSENLFTDVDPLEAAYILRGMISAAARYCKITGREDDMRDHADIVMRIFLKGLLR